MSHPPGAFFKARLLDNPEGANTARLRLRKALGETFPTPALFWHRRYYSNYCGDIEHGNIGPRGCDSVIFTAVYGMDSYRVFSNCPEYEVYAFRSDR